MEVLRVLESVAACIAIIGFWALMYVLYKLPRKPNCCDRTEHDCNQGRNCPFRGENCEKHR